MVTLQGACRSISEPSSSSLRRTPRRLDSLTVFDLTELYFRQHPEWEPATKTAAARSFNRARRWLLAPGAEPEGRDSEAVADYLESASFLPHRLNAELPTTAGGASVA